MVVHVGNCRGVDFGNPQIAGVLMKKYYQFHEEEKARSRELAFWQFVFWAFVAWLILSHYVEIGTFVWSYLKGG